MVGFFTENQNVAAAYCTQIKRAPLTEKIGSDCDIEGFAAWLDSLAGGGAEDSVAGFIQDEKRRLIEYEDADDADQGYQAVELSSDCVVSEIVGFGQAVGVGSEGSTGDTALRNILYDPGGSIGNGDFGLSSWGLLVSSVFASVEARSVVVVLLRALRFYCEIMSFGALEGWTFEYFIFSYC